MSISAELQQCYMLGGKKWPLKSLIKSPSSFPLALPFHLMTTSRTSGRGKAATGDWAEEWRRLCGLFSNPHIIKGGFSFWFCTTPRHHRTLDKDRVFSTPVIQLMDLEAKVTPWHHWVKSWEAVALQSQIQSNTSTSSPDLNLRIDIGTNCKGVF